MTPERWRGTTKYLREVFGAVEREEHPKQMATIMARAVEAGLPDISVSPEVGRLLKMLTVLATGARESTGRVLEVGTLAGHSGIWIARGLPYGGRLFTIEADDKHAAFARREFEAAGVLKRVELVSGLALDVLPRLSVEMGAGSLDLAFLDADKREYPEYARLIGPMLRVGGMLVADNALGSSEWWIDDAPERLSAQAKAAQAGVDRFNRAMAKDGCFETACVPIGHGILVAVKAR